MTTQDKTVRVTFTRDEFAKKPFENQGFLIGSHIIKTLARRGVPVIGVDGIVAVEKGKLTVEYVDGLDGDEWLYTYVGPLVPDSVIHSHPHGQHVHYTFGKPLAACEAEAVARPAQAAAELARRQEFQRKKLEEDDEL